MFEEKSAFLVILSKAFVEKVLKLRYFANQSAVALCPKGQNEE